MPSTRILKGALLYSGAQHITPRPFVFQFNPETITRRQVYSSGARNVSETIRFTLVLNAMEGMEQQDPVMTEHGIYPQIAALEEILSYQKQLSSNSWLSGLFGFGSSRFLIWIYGDRVIPVRLQNISIREQIHSSTLKPIHAVVDISLRVLTERDLRRNAEGLAMLAAYRQQRQRKSELIEASPV